MKHLIESINTGYWVKKNLNRNGVKIKRDGLYIFWRAMIQGSNGTEWESGFAKDYLLMDRWTAKCIPFNFNNLKNKLIDEFTAQNSDSIQQIIKQNHPNADTILINYFVLYGKEIEGNKKYEITFNKCFGTQKGAANVVDFDWSEYKKYEEEGRKMMAEEEAKEREKWMEQEARRKKNQEDWEERMSIESTYDNAGYINGWTDSFPTNDVKQRVEKAERENEYFVRNMGRCDNECVSDKYKVIWRVDTTD